MSENAIKRRETTSVWPWRPDEQENRKGSGETGWLRGAAIRQAVIMAVIAAAIYFLLHHEIFAIIVWSLAGVVLLLGLIWPPAYRPVHAFGQWLGKAVGILLLYVLLVPFFYLFFFPVSLVLRLIGRDPLNRKFREKNETYWIPRLHATDIGQYTRQFLREDKTAREMRRPVGGGEPRPEGGRS